MMNAGELKLIVEDFIQVRDAIRPHLNTGNLANPRQNKNDELIAGQIIAAKVANGDYKGQEEYEYTGRE